jgi:hypothetical protein
LNKECRNHPGSLLNQEWKIVIPFPQLNIWARVEIISLTIEESLKLVGQPYPRLQEKVDTTINKERRDEI